MVVGTQISPLLPYPHLVSRFEAEGDTTQGWRKVWRILHDHVFKLDIACTRPSLRELDSSLDDLDILRFLYRFKGGQLRVQMGESSPWGHAKKE